MVHDLDQEHGLVRRHREFEMLLPNRIGIIRVGHGLSDRRSPAKPQLDIGVCCRRVQARGLNDLDIQILNTHEYGASASSVTSGMHWRQSRLHPIMRNGNLEWCTAEQLVTYAGSSLRSHMKTGSSSSLVSSTGGHSLHSVHLL